MKILVTGMNKNQCTPNNYLRQQLKVIPSHYSLVKCLQDMGHEVEQRIVEVGESLDDFDEVIIFLAAPQQLLAMTTYNGLWALYRRPDAILAFDDWQTDGIFKGVFSCRKWEELSRQFNIDVSCDKTVTLDVVTRYRDEFLAAAAQASAKRNRMMISAFAGGDLQQIFPSEVYDKKNPEAGVIAAGYPKELLFSYNPNPYHLNRRPFYYGDTQDENSTQEWPGPIPFDNKRQQFNFASLVQGRTQKWLKTQGIDIKSENDDAFKCGGWDVIRYGWRKEGQDRLTEGQMCQVFAQDWAALMPGYHHSGSGWWRARPLQVADAFSILVGEPDELSLYYGPDYTAPTALEITQLTNAERKVVAEEQHSRIYSRHPLDKNIQREELNKILQAPKSK